MSKQVIFVNNGLLYLSRKFDKLEIGNTYTVIQEVKTDHLRYIIKDYENYQPYADRFIDAEVEVCEE